MMKLILYPILLVVFIPLASSANIRVRDHVHAVKPAEVLKNWDSDDTEGSDDSLQIARIQPDFQDSVRSGRQKRIKEVAKARSQPKPERVPNRPPPDPAAAGNEGRRPPAGREPGGMQPDGGMNRGGAAGGQGGMNGGGQGGGRQQPPPQRGR